MALLLRKMCQDTLNEADLDAFHADIDPDSKYLTLYTPCGKTFASVHGVCFASTRPSKDEMPYAVELLGHWLKRNEKTIQDYLQAFETVQRLKNTDTASPLPGDYEFVTKNETCHREDPYTGVYRYHSTICGYQVSNEFEAYGFNLNHQIIKWSGRKTTEKAQLFAREPGRKLGPAAATLKAARNRCDDLIALQDAKDLMESIHGELNSCSD